MMMTPTPTTRTTTTTKEHEESHFDLIIEQQGGCQSQPRVSEADDRLSKKCLTTTTTTTTSSTTEFTWRSVILGTIIGCILAAQNVYFGLRNGMSFGDGMVSAILGYGVMKVLLKHVFLQSQDSFDLHEHVILQTAAAANISIIFSGGFSHYILAMSPQVQSANELGRATDTWVPTYGHCLVWLLLAGFLGFFMSQPYRTKLIVQQTLPWPSPTATAVVLRALHQVNSKGRALTRRIVYSTVLSFAWQWFKWMFDGQHQMSRWPIFGPVAAKYSWYTDWSPAYIASGMLTTKKAAFSMALGGIYGFCILYPIAEAHRGMDGWYRTEAKGMHGVKAYWFLSALGMLVTDSLYQSLKVMGMPVLRHCLNKARGNILDPNEPNELNELKETEAPHRLVPTKFWVTGLALNVVVMVVIVPLLFPVQWYLVVPTLLISSLVGYGICLGGALTGTFLISAAGMLMIILFGSMAGNVLGALWLAGIAIITIGSTEQVLVDYQVAHLTGTSPRQMFKAQMIAAAVGFFVTPLSYNLFMNAFEISDMHGPFTAPGGVALRSLAVLFVDGFHDMPGHVAQFVFPSIGLALILSLLNDLLPERWARYVPCTMAFSYGFYVNGSFPFNMALGQLVKLWWASYDPDAESECGAITAGGMIAGEGLAAITQAIATMCQIQPPAGMAIRFPVYEAA